MQQQQQHTGQGYVEKTHIFEPLSSFIFKLTESFT